MSYDPNSTDAMFSRIIVKIEEQDRMAAAARDEFMGVLREIRDEVKKTNGRVSGLEKWRAVINAKVATIAAGISVVGSIAGWLIEKFLWHG